MSWDIWIKMDTGAGNNLCSESLNYTHNCNPMIRAALDAVGQLEPLGPDHLYALDDMPCEKAGKILSKALDWWKAQPPALFEAMEPANGWGDAKSAYRFWEEVKNLCLRHPKATLVVSG